MNATLRHGLWLAFAIARATVGIALALVVGVLVFALFTGPGASLGLRIAERATGGMIAADGVEGALWGPLKIARLTITLNGADIEIDDVTLDADLPQLARRRIDVRRLQAARVAVTIKPGSDQDDETPSGGALTQLPFALAVHDARVGALRIATGGGSEPIAIDDLALAATWTGDRVVVERLAATTPWVGRARLDGIATLHPDAVEIRPLHTEGFAVATIEGRFGYGTASDLHLRWQKIAWPPDGAADGAADVASGGGEAHWRGLPDDYQFDLNGALSLPNLSLSVSTQGSGSLSAVRLARLDAQALGGTLHAQADVSWHDGLRIDGSGRVAGMKPELYTLPALGKELPGVVNGTFEAQTTIADGKPDVRFGARLQNSKLRHYPLSAEASGHYTCDTLHFDVLKASSGRVAIDARGQVLPTLDAQAKVDAQDLADAWPALAGALRGTVSARGPLPGPKALPAVVADLQIDHFGYGGVQIAAAQLKADVDPRRRIDLDLDVHDANAGASVKTAKLAIHGPASAHDIALSVDSDRGTVELAAHGALDVDRPAWAGEIRSGRIAPAGLAPWTLEEPTALGADARDVTLDPLCWTADGARVCVGVKRNGEARRIDFALSDFALKYLQPLIGGPDIDLVLQASGFAELGPRGLQDVRLDVATDGGRWQLGGLPAIELKPAHLNIDDQSAGGTKVRLELPFSTGTVRGEATLAAGPAFMARALSGTLDIDMPDLGWLRLVSTEVGRSAGEGQGHFQLEGTLAAPRFRGHLELKNGEVDLVTPGIALKQIGLRADAAGDGDITLDGEATSDGGTARLSGVINPLVDPLKFDLKLTGEKFQAMKTSDARVWVSPDLHATLADRQLQVDGTVLVPKAEITPKNLGDGSVSASGDQVIVGNDPGAQQRKDLRINATVTMKLGDDVRFDGFGLKSRLKGQVQAIEQPGVTTRAHGEINLVDGKYKAYGQDLTIETGRLIFSDGPVTEPALEVRATRKPTDEVTVGLYVRGTLKKPEFKLFSTPAMTQQQQLAWLVLGHQLSSTSSSDKEMVNSAATSLGLAGGEWLANRLGSKIGIDEITVGTDPNDTTATNDQAMFTVGKYLSPKLFISYGVGLFQQGHTFRLQYDIGHGFKVRTETGTESGGDVLYSFDRK
ncbi:MAG: translocation/assembly module TamB domain-containing protein [Solimonas sp.]